MAATIIGNGRSRFSPTLPPPARAAAATFFEEDLFFAMETDHRGGRGAISERGSGGWEGCEDRRSIVEGPCPLPHAGRSVPKVRPRRPSLPIGSTEGHGKATLAGARFRQSAEIHSALARARALPRRRSISPQAVDIAANPQALNSLHRDVVNVCAWFRRRGVAVDPEEVFTELLILR